MVRWPKQCRPSITWMQPRRTSSFGEQLVDALALEHDRALGDLAALGVEQVGDRLQRRGLAGAVRAEQRHDAAARHGRATRPSARGSRGRRSTSMLLTDEDRCRRARARVDVLCGVMDSPSQGSRCTVLAHRWRGAGMRGPPVIPGLRCGRARALPAAEGQPRYDACRRPRCASASRRSSGISFGGLARAADGPRPSCGAIQSETLTHLVPSHWCDEQLVVAVVVLAGHLDRARRSPPARSPSGAPR